MSYGEKLSEELGRVGITGHRRARIVAEFEDHLECDKQADLGSPADLARQFADELGTSRVRGAARWSFAALSLAGVLFGLVFLTAPPQAFGRVPAGVAWPDRVANVVGVLAPQVAFVAGLLARLRVLQRRRQRVIPRAEAQIVMRRVIVGLLTGMLSMLAVGVMAVELRRWSPGWWTTLAEMAAAVGLAALLLAAPAVVAGARLRPTSPGAAGDVFDDLGSLAPASLRGRPWRFALWVAGLIFLLMTATGILASDGYDGAIRGLADGLACLLGFATLGRYLGLWSPETS